MNKSILCLCFLLLCPQLLRAQDGTPVESNKNLEEIKRINEKLKYNQIFIDSKIRSLNVQKSMIDRNAKRLNKFDEKIKTMKTHLQELMSKDEVIMPLVSCWLESLDTKGKLDKSCEDVKRFPEPIKRFRAAHKKENVIIYEMYIEIAESKEEINQRIRASQEYIEKTNSEIGELEAERYELEKSRLSINSTNLKPHVLDAASTGEACKQVVERTLSLIESKHSEGAKIEPRPIEIHGAPPKRVEGKPTALVIPAATDGNPALLAARKVKVKTSTDISKKIKDIEQAFPGAGKSNPANLRLETIKITSKHPRFKSEELGKSKPKPYRHVELETRLQLLYQGDKLVALKRLEVYEDYQDRRAIEKEFKEFSHDPNCSLSSYKSLNEREDQKFCHEYFDTLGTSEMAIDHIPREGHDQLSLGSCMVGKDNLPMGNPRYPFVRLDVWKGHNLKLMIDKLSILIRRNVANGYISNKFDIEWLTTNKQPEMSEAVAQACKGVIEDKGQYEQGEILSWFNLRCASFAPFYKAKDSSSQPASTRTPNARAQ